MEFNLDPERITKKMLLEAHTEEEYMSFYLGITPNKEMHCNPLRADKNPTCTFYRSKSDELIFKDWKTAWHANFIDIVMAKFDASYGKAINIIANDFGLIHKAHYTKNDAAIEYKGEKVDAKSETHIQATVTEFTEEQLKWWGGFGITHPTLKKYNVFPVTDVFLNGNFVYSASKANPIYGYYFGKEEGGRYLVVC